MLTLFLISVVLFYFIPTLVAVLNKNPHPVSFFFSNLLFAAFPFVWIGLLIRALWFSKPIVISVKTVRG
jgi:hypothetical protein